jgi:hypothetical protein
VLAHQPPGSCVRPSSAAVGSKQRWSCGHAMGINRGGLLGAVSLRQRGVARYRADEEGISSALQEAALTDEDEEEEQQEVAEGAIACLLLACSSLG